MTRFGWRAGKSPVGIARHFNRTQTGGGSLSKPQKSRRMSASMKQPRNRRLGIAILVLALCAIWLLRPRKPNPRIVAPNDRVLEFCGATRGDQIAGLPDQMIHINPLLPKWRRMVVQYYFTGHPPRVVNELLWNLSYGPTKGPAPIASSNPNEVVLWFHSPNSAVSTSGETTNCFALRCVADDLTEYGPIYYANPRGGNQWEDVAIPARDYARAVKFNIYWADENHFIETWPTLQDRHPRVILGNSVFQIVQGHLSHAAPVVQSSTFLGSFTVSEP